MTQAPPPGAAQDRVRLEALLHELGELIGTRAPTPPWHREGLACPCWRCQCLRICKYGPEPDGRDYAADM